MPQRIPQGWGNPPEDYDAHWGQLNCWKGRCILDIGADVGSSADYFLLLGARQVIAVEPAERFWPQLVENSKKIPEIVPVNLGIESPNDLEMLIRQHHPGVVKMDCEGCEIHLLGVSEDAIRIAKDYAIEAHSTDLLDQCKKKLLSCGFKLVQEFPYLNVFVIHMRKER